MSNSQWLRAEQYPTKRQADAVADLFAAEYPRAFVEVVKVKSPGQRASWRAVAWPS